MGRFILVVSTLALTCAGVRQLGAQAPEESPGTGLRKHFTFGLRVRDFPLTSTGTIADQTTMTTTAATSAVPAKDWSYTTTSRSPWWGAGLAFEYAVDSHWTLSADVLMNRLHYTKATTISWGTDDPTTTADERSHEFHTEDTRGTFYDVPVLVHYRGLFRDGAFSSFFISAGAAFRTVTKVKTSTAITYSDATTGTDNTTATIGRRELIGAVTGIGMRVVDDFHIVWTPEIRYTRWDGSTFNSDSTASPRSQVEVALGFTF
jgi:hypothetical protein